MPKAHRVAQYAAHRTEVPETMRQIVEHKTEE
jgi:hypothetical protein